MGHMNCIQRKYGPNGRKKHISRYYGWWRIIESSQVPKDNIGTALVSLTKY